MRVFLCPRLRPDPKALFSLSPLFSPQIHCGGFGGGLGHRFALGLGETAMVHWDWYLDKNEVQCEELMQVG